MPLNWGCCVWELCPPTSLCDWHSPLPSHVSFLVFSNLLSRARSSFCHSDLPSSSPCPPPPAAPPRPHSIAWCSRLRAVASEHHRTSRLWTSLPAWRSPNTPYPTPFVPVSQILHKLQAPASGCPRGQLWGNGMTPAFGLHARTYSSITGGAQKVCWRYWGSPGWKS